VRSHAGAEGLFQFMPKTAQGLGVEALNPASAADGAARYLEDLMDRFGGDPIKALAAYNWGQGNLSKLLKKYPNGDEWQKHLPKETSNYIRKVGNGLGRSFVARQQSGEEISEEEQLEEANRRNGRLAEAGLPPLSLEGALSSLFFGLIAKFIEAKIGKIEQGVPPSSTSPAPEQTTQEPITTGDKTPATTPSTRTAQTRTSAPALA
jgi:hypothetical protein